MSEIGILERVMARYGHEQFMPGLERTAELFTPFKLAQKARGVRVITVAGTNGKGQTSTTMASALALSGLSVALWRSPHVYSITERFWFNGHEVEENDLSELVDEAMKKWPSGVSFYEFLLVVFCLWAEEVKAKVLVLEVGLGGRLDAVNHFDAEMVVLTSIGRDHVDYLGPRLDGILAEKMGVLRQESVLVSRLTLQYLKDRVTAQKWFNVEGVFKDYWEENRALAAEAVRVFLKAAKRPEMPHVSLPARQEKMTFGKNELIFVGAHNVEGMRALKRSVGDDFSHLIVSFSRRSTQELLAMKKILSRDFPLSEKWLVPFDHPKALPSCELWKLVDVDNRWIGIDDKEAFNRLELDEAKRILLCGSFYFFSAWREGLRARELAI